MSIFINQATQFIIQGITGKEGQRAASFMMSAGSRVVGGVRPGKAGELVEGIPVYDTVKDIIKAFPAKESGSHSYAIASVIAVPPAVVKGAAEEAILAGVKFLIPIAEGVPVKDMAFLYELASKYGARILGPNTVGMIVPGVCKAGVIGGADNRAFMPGPVGIVSKSGGMTSETARLLSSAGIGQSTCVNIGGDKLIGTDFVNCLKAFAQDDQTKAVVLFGEIGGRYEEEAAEYLKSSAYSKPVIAFISGASAERFKGMTLGHAGAIIHGQQGTRASKVRALQDAGVIVVDVHHEIVGEVKRVLTG